MTDLLNRLKPENKYQEDVLSEIIRMSQHEPPKLGPFCLTCHGLCLHIILKLPVFPYEIGDLVQLIEKEKGPLKNLITDHPQLGDLVLIKPAQKELADNSVFCKKRAENQRAWHSGIYLTNIGSREYMFSNVGSRKYVCSKIKSNPFGLTDVYKLENIDGAKSRYESEFKTKCNVRYYNMN